MALCKKDLKFPSRFMPSHGWLSQIGQPVQVWDTACAPWMVCIYPHDWAIPGQYLGNSCSKFWQTRYTWKGLNMGTFSPVKPEVCPIWLKDYWNTYYGKKNLKTQTVKQSTFFMLYFCQKKLRGIQPVSICGCWWSNQAPHQLLLGDQPSNEASRDNEGLATLSNRRGTQHPVWNIENDSLSLVQSCGIQRPAANVIQLYMWHFDMTIEFTFDNQSNHRYL